MAVELWPDPKHYFDLALTETDPLSRILSLNAAMQSAPARSWLAMRAAAYAELAAAQQGMPRVLALRECAKDYAAALALQRHPADPQALAGSGDEALQAARQAALMELFQLTRDARYLDVAAGQRRDLP